MTNVVPEPITPPKRIRHRLRLGIVVGLILVAAWFGVGGYDRLTESNPRWKLPNGDTIEVLTFENYYEVSYSLVGGQRIEGAHYLWLQFRSTLANRQRDSSDAAAAAAVVCQQADSAGLRRIKVQPTRTSFFGLFKTSTTRWFQVMPGGQCQRIPA